MRQHDRITIEELSRQLGRDRREIEKLVNRGRIPGRKVGGMWQFHPTEITHWLEQEMREYTDRELAVVEESQPPGETDAEVPVSGLLKRETVEVPLDARTKRSVLEGLVEVAGRTWQIWEPATVLNAVREREDVFSTGFENGVAIPHPRNPLPECLGESLVAFGRTPRGIPFGAPGRGLSDLFFLVLCRDSNTHLRVLARLGRMIQTDGFLEELREAEGGDAAHRSICACDEKVAGA